jgi:hypothetical protein
MNSFGKELVRYARAFPGILPEQSQGYLAGLKLPLSSSNVKQKPRRCGFFV